MQVVLSYMRYKQFSLSFLWSPFMDNHAKILIQYSSEVNDQCTHKTFAHFSCSMPKKRVCVRRIFAIVIQCSQLALFCIVSGNKGFLS